jgi:ABC-type maltose transport system permease subunit
VEYNIWTFVLHFLNVSNAPPESKKKPKSLRKVEYKLAENSNVSTVLASKLTNTIVLTCYCCSRIVSPNELLACMFHRMRTTGFLLVFRQGLLLRNQYCIPLVVIILFGNLMSLTSLTKSALSNSSLGANLPVKTTSVPFKDFVQKTQDLLCV